MSIIAGLSRSRSPFAIGSKGIQESEKREFSHAYIEYVCPLTKEVMISQASHGYVNEVNKSIFIKHNVIIKEYKLECTDEQFIEVLTFIKKNLGLPYSRMQILIIAIKKLLHISVNYENKGSEYICSEWAIMICKILGVEAPDKLDDFTPSDLDTLLSKQLKENK